MPEKGTPKYAQYALSESEWELTSYIIEVLQV
jgi:hypothetical protein